MNDKATSLFLPVLQIITGFLATLAFFGLIYNKAPIKSIVISLLIALIGFSLGFKEIVAYVKKQ